MAIQLSTKEDLQNLLIQHPSFGFVASRTVRKEIIFVYTAKFVEPCYGSPKIWVQISQDKVNGQSP